MGEFHEVTHTSHKVTGIYMLNFKPYFKCLP